MPEKKTRYSAVTEAGYGYPDGFVALGESALLTETEAERGIASGQLAPTPEAPKKTGTKPETEETT